MLYRITNWWQRLRFDQIAKTILQTSPLKINSSNLRIVSSVSHEDLLMYLIAIKSFYRFVQNGDVVILNDGSLTEDDIGILKQHVNPIAILDLEKVPYSHGKKGVRWGILLAIADMLDDHYVLHIDSDTLTLGHPTEVVEAISTNRSFTLGTKDGTNLVSADQISDFVKNNPSAHVQVVAERNLSKLDNREHLKYVRGNSGLTGYAKGSFSREIAESFYLDMERLIGGKIKERGSFQFSSNFFVANGIDPLVLPLERYPCVTPQILESLEPSVFLHFIGRYRFDGGLYRDLVRQFLKDSLPDKLRSIR